MYIFLHTLSTMNILDSIFFIACCFYDFREWHPREWGEIPYFKEGKDGNKHLVFLMLDLKIDS